MRPGDTSELPVILSTEPNKINKILARLMQETARLKNGDQLKKALYLMGLKGLLTQVISEARQQMPTDRTSSSINLEDISPVIFFFILKDVDSPKDKKGMGKKTTNDENNEILANLIQETERLEDGSELKKAISSMNPDLLTQAINEALQKMPKNRALSSISLEDIAPFIFSFTLSDEEQIELATQAPDESWIRLFEEKSILNRFMRTLLETPTRKRLVFVKTFVDKAVAVGKQDILGEVDKVDGHKGFTPLMYAMLGLKQNLDTGGDKDDYKYWIALAIGIAKKTLTTSFNMEVEREDKVKTFFDVFLEVAEKISRYDKDFYSLAQILRYNVASVVGNDHKLLGALLGSLEKNPGNEIMMGLLEEAVIKWDTSPTVWKKIFTDEEFKQDYGKFRGYDFYRRFILMILKRHEQLNKQDDKNQLKNNLVEIAVGVSTADEHPVLLSLFGLLKKNYSEKKFIDFSEWLVLYQPDQVWNYIVKDDEYHGAIGRKFIKVMSQKRKCLKEQYKDKESKLKIRLLDLYIENREAHSADSSNPLIVFIKDLFKRLLEFFSEKTETHEHDTFHSWSHFFGGYAKNEKLEAAKKARGKLKKGEAIKKEDLDSAAQQGLLGQLLFCNAG